MDQTLRSFLRELTGPQRVQFVDTLFAILTCTDASTLTDLKEGGLKTASAMVKALQKLDKPTRKALTDTLKLLVKSGARSAFEELGISRLRDNRLIEAISDTSKRTAARKFPSHTKDPPPMTLHDYLFTLLLAMAPVSELRGAIPFGLAHDIPQALLYPSCILANLLPVPFVILFLRRILAWMQRKGGRLASAAGWLEKAGQSQICPHQRSGASGALSFRRHSPARHGCMDRRARRSASGKAAFPRHALHRGRRHDRLLHRRAFVQGHHPLPVYRFL